jgi:N-acetylneuraminic acid mutarotase
MGAAHGYSVEGQNNLFRRVKLESGSEWESLGEVPRRQGLALVAYQNKIYRIGGFEARNAAGEVEVLVSTPDFEVFDPATSKWTALAPLPEPRSSFDAVVAGDILYVVGGWSLGQGDEDSQWHETAWQMDLSQNNADWKPMPSPPATRRAHALAELDGKIYMIGGMDEDGDPTTSAFVFDTKTGQWSDAPELPGQPMDGFGSSAFNIGGRIIVSTFSGQVVQLNDDGSAWEQLPKLETGRFFHRLVAIDKTRFAILGGTGSTGKQTSVLVIDRTAK